MKLTTNDETTRIETPRAGVPRPTLRQIPDDEAKTQFFVVPAKRAVDEALSDSDIVAAVEDAPRRARNSFPEPPRNRPRVFERPAQADVTTLRPSRGDADESTQLRPQMHEPMTVRVRPETRVAPIESSVVVALEALQPPPPMPPQPKRSSSIPPASYSVPAIETTVEIPTFKRMSPIKIAALSMAAVVAPFACIVAMLGSADPPMVHAAAAMPPAVSQAVSVIASTAIAPTPIAPTVAAPVVAQAAAVAPAPAPQPLAATALAAHRAPAPIVRPAPMAGAIAAAAPRPMARAVAPAAPAAPAAKPKTKGAVAATELPDAQAADALARAQLEAALR